MTSPATISASFEHEGRVCTVQAVVTVEESRRCGLAPFRFKIESLTVTRGALTMEPMRSTKLYDAASQALYEEVVRQRRQS